MGFLKPTIIGALWRMVGALSKLGQKSLGTLTLLRIRTLSNSKFPTLAVFFPAEIAIRAPNIPNQALPAHDLYPALGYRRIQNGLVTSNRRVTAVCSNDEFLIPDSVDPGPWNVRIGQPTVGGILRQDNSNALINLRQKGDTIPQGIFVGSWSPHNWYHWVVDTLPSIFLASRLPPEFDDYPLLLPASGVSRASWLEPLQLVQGTRKIVYLSADHYTKVSDLVWMDSPSCPGPLPITRSGFPRFKIHGSAMRAYRDHILNQLGLGGVQPPASAKIFLARAQNGNRPYNQDELIRVAENFGFEPVFLEELNFRESVQVMLGARYVIGPHGAGWANALFCQEGAQAGMWTWRGSRDDNWFSNIAAVQKMTFSTIFSDGAGDVPSLNLSPNKLEKLIASL
jgi:hypothetical protein